MMDEAREHEIPLGSPLEPSNEHNLVPVQRPTFAYNPQQEVAGLLHNAIKYEGNGIFCGKYRYDYDVRYTYKIVGSEFSGLEVAELDDRGNIIPPPGLTVQDVMDNFIHPYDVARNWYLFEDEVRYAINVSYPWTKKLWNMDFVAGFRRNNILPTTRRDRGNDLLVDRTNANSVNESFVVSGGYNLVPDVGPLGLWMNDGPDKYIITGRTHRNNLDFRLLVDVYTRSLEDFTHTNTGLVDAVRAFIPENYETSIVFGPDTVNCQVVHETREQDNIAIVMPQVILNETASEFFVVNNQKTGNTGPTVLTLDNTENPTATYTITIPDGTGGVTLSPHLQMQVNGNARHHNNTVNEYNEIFVRNIAPVFPDMGTGIASIEDIVIEIDHAIISTAGNDDSLDTITRIYGLAPTESARNLRVDGGELITQLAISCKITGGVTGRPVQTTPDFWMGKRAVVRLDFEVTTRLTVMITLPAQEAQDVQTPRLDHDRSQFLVPATPANKAAWQRDSEEQAEQLLRETYPGVENIRFDSGADDKGRNSSWAIAYGQLPAQPEREAPGAGGLAILNASVVCQDIESGDWVTIQHDMPDGVYLERVDGVPANIQTPDKVAFPLMFTGSVVMNEDLCSGTAMLVTSEQSSSRRSQELGITFSFIPIKVKYIKDVRFRRSNRDVIALNQGNQIIPCTVKFNEWDFADTLTTEDGLTQPAGGGGGIQIPPAPIPDRGQLNPMPSSWVANPPLAPPFHPDMSQAPTIPMPNFKHPDPPEYPNLPPEVMAELAAVQAPNFTNSPLIGPPPTDFTQDPWEPTPPTPPPPNPPLVPPMPDPADLPANFNTWPQNEQDDWIDEWQQQWLEDETEKWEEDWTNQWITDWYNKPLAEQQADWTAWRITQLEEEFVDRRKQQIILEYQQLWIMEWISNDPDSQQLHAQWWAQQSALQALWLEEQRRNHVENWQNNWRQDREDQWWRQETARWQQQWINNWLAQNRTIGWEHRQCIWLEYQGLSSTEVRVVRHVIKLPHQNIFELALAGGFGRIWEPLRMTLTVVERVGHVRSTGLPFDMRGSMLAQAVREPELNAPGRWRLTNLSDWTLRRVRVRRCFILSSNGYTRNAALSTVTGSFDDLQVDIMIPTNRLLALRYDNGAWDYDTVRGIPELELSFDEDYMRTIQFSDGQWVTDSSLPFNEFVSSIEANLINMILIREMLDDDPEIIDALNRVLYLVFVGASLLSINRFISQSPLALWGQLTSLVAILTNHTGANALINEANDGGVYRLVFRDSDKANFDFYPKGIYIRGNENIRYLGYAHRHTMNDFNEVDVRFDYRERDEVTWNRNVTVTMFDRDWQGEDGHGYIVCEAHDPIAGTMDRLELANPDVDYAIITHQMDTDLATENMFWIDNQHILKATTRDFQLLKMDSEGEWFVHQRIDRYTLLGKDIEIYKYGVTCAEEQYPVFYVLRPHATGLTIQLMTMDRLNEADYFGHMMRVRKSINLRFMDAIQMGFASTRICFLGTPPTPTHFLNTVKVTSTRVGAQVLIGMQFDRGVNQWTVVMNAAPANLGRFVFNGYGCVGPDGTVTGSAVPMYAMNMRSGINVRIVEKPAPIGAFNRRRQAYVSGANLVFIDNGFNRGICISAKITNGRFRLKALPLRFSQHQVRDKGGKGCNDTSTRLRWVSPPNFGFERFVATWSWSTALAALTMNTWTNSAVLDESEDFVEIDPIENKIETTPRNDFWIRLGLAVAMHAMQIGMQIAVNKAIGSFELPAQPIPMGNQRVNPNLPDANSGHTFLTNVDNPNGGGNSAEFKAMSVEKQLDVLAQETAIRARDAELQAAHNAARKARSVQITHGTLDILHNIFEAATSGASKAVEAVSVARARLGCSSLYSVGPSQNVWGGPGFVQASFTRGSRIMGSCSWGHGAVGNGVIFVPAWPKIPIPMSGTLDINTGDVGINPVSDFQPTYDFRLMFQPNFNVGHKHLMYNYPTKDVHDHEIKQTVFQPRVGREQTKLFDSDIVRSRDYHRMVLQFNQWDERTFVTDNCSIVQGVDTYHSDNDIVDVPYQVDAGYPVFMQPGTFDYCVYPEAELFYTAMMGGVSAVSIRDTVVLDGEPSNVVIRNGMPLIASAYTCIEVTDVITKDTIRPRVYSGDTLLFPTTGMNVIKGLQVMHGCDAYNNRVAKLVGDAGTDVAVAQYLHSHVAQGPVKTGSIVPPMKLLGKFSKLPILDTYPHAVKMFAEYMGNLSKATENMLGFRYAIPVVHKTLDILPAAIQTLAPYKPHVIDGVTSFTTPVRTTTPLNKALSSRDFVIYGEPYRITDEYIARISTEMGTVALEDVVATLGMIFLGNTPNTAWFYAPAVNAFYTFTNNNLRHEADAFRFENVGDGSWDFVSQEIAFKVLLGREIDKSRIFDHIMRVSNNFHGMIYPPNEHITGSKDTFDLTGTALGMAIQGKHRGQVYRYVMHDYMFREQITSGQMQGVPGIDRFTNRINDGLVINHGNWIKVKGNSVDDFWSERKYDWEDIRFNRIYGYFLEPFKLATSFLGVDNQTDCTFEWEITFALTPFMRRILRDKYVTVHLACETIIPGGAAVSNVQNLYLHESMFGRTRIDGSLGTSKNNVGYYSFRYDGRNGAGNSEKLYIWSDGCVALRSLKMFAKVITQRRTSPLITQIDVQHMKEL